MRRDKGTSSYGMQILQPCTQDTPAPPPHTELTRIRISQPSPAPAVSSLPPVPPLRIPSPFLFPPTQLRLARSMRSLPSVCTEEVEDLVRQRLADPAADDATIRSQVNGIMAAFDKNCDGEVRVPAQAQLPFWTLPP